MRGISADDIVDGVKRALRREEIPLSPLKLNGLVADVQRAMAEFKATPCEKAIGRAALKRIYDLAHEPRLQGERIMEAVRAAERDKRSNRRPREVKHLSDLGREEPLQDEDVKEIRVRILGLSAAAFRYMETLAAQVVPKAFPDDAYDGDFRSWVRDAVPEKIIYVALLLTHTGAEIVPGRSRGTGKRAHPRIEPRILGNVRGGTEGQPRKGRPAATREFLLVVSLGCAWVTATGGLPKSGRSDHTSFGDLVYRVFLWLDLPDGGATSALRKYSELLRMAEPKRSASVPGRARRSDLGGKAAIPLA
jgi:hypothetical protein